MRVRIAVGGSVFLMIGMYFIMMMIFCMVCWAGVVCVEFFWFLAEYVEEMVDRRLWG